METNNFDTLSEAMNALTKDGFTEDFKAGKEHIVGLYSKNEYHPSQLKIIKSFRFEGMTNPSDQANLYAIIADDQSKGTLTLSYSAESDQNEELIKQIPMSQE
ncbi:MULTISPECIES: phosphoribosylpyrophosphate synthetase [Reichenbachiella]|uniref:Phosphoribosylpyrophosphate synthetase n=1 Tax=Reichenbachiella agariperforans TaxID=156994 RepID=A0A1M6JH20_REIAG|nr:MULTISPECIES: phosphoribosylpyrophosphate synthetase [Reichenbachiella]MBU2913194.1 phosphoribosylpyrophosphate synthetase [Reichenbachiella agariperforans]RJE74807.1 phosphoribosylpyrophosphate synthetase [Reichenbachiella sp. MSK19-1]SHJ45977.1 hypothetical protein SAMN04488028_101190 [Reichenbachiella agariperforans]